MFVHLKLVKSDYVKLTYNKLIKIFINWRTKKVAQKDYVKRGCITLRKNKHLEKKKSNQKLLKIIFSIAITIVIIFIGYLYYVRKNKCVSLLNKTILSDKNQQVSSLPPKPEERWQYIKELEKRGTNLLNLNNLRESNINNSTTKLTNEQRQLLKQIDADRHSPATNLIEASNNNKLSSSHVIDNTTLTESSLRLRYALHTEHQINKKQKILVQCGLFKNLEQAESIKTNLEFLGLESKVNLIEGWYQIILGPYNNEETAKKIYDRANFVVISGCIIHKSKEVEK